MTFELLSELRRVEVIASGRGVRDRLRLDRVYGKARWRKMKGFATIRFGDTATVSYEEIHWYEAHGVGRVEFKIKFRP
jgi:hypothetical protein